MNRNENKNSSWWKRRTGMERALTLVAVCATIAVIVLVATLYAFHLAGANEPEICMTPGCIRAASKVLDNLDPKVKPCDNFYKFACGNYKQHTSIPDDETSINGFSEVHDKLKSQLRFMFESPSEVDEIKPFRLAKDMYKACMNKSLIASRGIQPMLKILNNLGGWPLLVGPSWDASAFTWQKSVRNFRKKGFNMNYLLAVFIGINVKNSNTRIIQMDQVYPGLSREYLIKGLKDHIVSAYYEYMVDVAVIYGALRERAARELKDVLLLQISLANITLPREKRRNSTEMYNPYTIAELKTLHPSVSWLEYINALLPPGLTVGEDEVVIVRNPSFIKNLEGILKKTPKRVLANYLMWRLSSDFMLTEELQKRRLDFYTVLIGITEQHRWKQCLGYASGSFYLAVGSLYVKNYFNEDAKNTVLEMVNRIRAAFTSILENIDWMDDETRQNALEKARSIKNYIGYHDDLLDVNKLEKFYEGIEIDKDLYMESELNISIFWTDHYMNKLRKPVNESLWESVAYPAMVNAFYSMQGNNIQFPAGILQGVFYASDRPQYMNYGAIGSIIGHEITHGFDDEGRQFDKDGNLVDWWAPETKEAYLKKAQCIIDQYGNFTQLEVKQNLNGINTQGENIADNGGVKEAYSAYTKWVEENGEEPQLPGLDYTPRQMFWLSAANLWCSKYRPESMKLQITLGFHSPEEFRVLGPFVNNEDFAKDFGCPLGSPMNPHHKCEVW